MFRKTRPSSQSYQVAAVCGAPLGLTVATTAGFGSARNASISGGTGTPAANQSGARINANAYAEAQDFLPLKGIDHVEFWVGNARQAAHYYRALWGFTPIAYAGLETGMRDRSSYVMRQNDITIVLTGALSPDGASVLLDQLLRDRQP